MKNKWGLIFVTCLAIVLMSSNVATAKVPDVRGMPAYASLLEDYAYFSRTQWQNSVRDDGTQYITFLGWYNAEKIVHDSIQKYEKGNAGVKMTGATGLPTLDALFFSSMENLERKTGNASTWLNTALAGGKFNNIVFHLELSLDRNGNVTRQSISHYAGFREKAYSGALDLEYILRNNYLPLEIISEFPNLYDINRQLNQREEKAEAATKICTEAAETFVKKHKNTLVTYYFQSTILPENRTALDIIEISLVTDNELVLSRWDITIIDERADKEKNELIKTHTRIFNEPTGEGWDLSNKIDTYRGRTERFPVKLEELDRRFEYELKRRTSQNEYLLKTSPHMREELTEQHEKWLAQNKKAREELIQENAHEKELLIGFEVEYDETLQNYLDSILVDIPKSNEIVSSRIGEQVRVNFGVSLPRDTYDYDRIIENNSCPPKFITERIPELQNRFIEIARSPVNSKFELTLCKDFGACDYYKAIAEDGTVIVFINTLKSANQEENKAPEHNEE